MTDETERRVWQLVDELEKTMEEAIEDGNPAKYRVQREVLVRECLADLDRILSI